ncbi:amino acid ABC transporter permease [Pararhizobium sp. YC-54]|uniref:amino acid ABC transporter permease n=1 Tax=Pararhizobium sp. YC-54 TaxID=2986920 RepID=UPI0021F7FB9A|nr:amino acid ABC transporter permease [Pararhizobium sp. YC-54]MCW0001726.1 amino acid ABC transporter permease [Pararhizobium sp. YC-54]
MYEFFFILIPRHFPFLLEGAVVTLQLTLTSMVCGICIGLAVAIGRIGSKAPLKWLLAAYVEIWRDVPLIVQLLVIYFSLPTVGISLPAFWAGVLGLSLNLGAYLSEVFRSTILSIDPGQREAGESTGMSRLLVYRRVVLPQALRIAVPTVGGYFVSLLKDSSLVSFVSINELLRNGTIVISNTFRTMEIYLMVAIIYFALSFTASRAVLWIERALTPRYLRRNWEPSLSPKTSEVPA